MTHDLARAVTRKIAENPPEIGLVQVASVQKPGKGIRALLYPAICHQTKDIQHLRLQQPLDGHASHFPAAPPFARQPNRPNAVLPTQFHDNSQDPRQHMDVLVTVEMAWDQASRQDLLDLS